MNMRKKLLAICTLLSLLLPFGTACAEEEEPVNVGVSQTRRWQPAQTKAPKQAAPNITILNSARGCEIDEGFFVTADFLWWKANDDSINWTLVVTDTLLNTSSNFASTHYVDPNWKPAFRVGMGWNTAHDDWDLYLNWTWYNNTTRESITAETSSAAGMGQIGIAALWLPTVQAGNRAANYRWRLRHNMFDIELGRKFFVSRKLALRPFGGVRGGWINRSLTINYLNPEASLSPPVTTPGSYKDENNYWGIGPRFGSNSEWGLGSGFQIYADLAAALLYGQIFKFRARAEEQVSGSLTEVADFTQNNDRWRVIPNLQLFLGLGWGKCFADQDLFLAIKAGWEVNQYWDLSNFLNPTRAENFRSEKFSSITLQGLTTKVDFEF